MSKIVEDLLASFTRLWWGSDSGMPDLGPVYTVREQLKNESHLNCSMRLLTEEMKNPPRSPSQRLATRERLIAAFFDFTKEAFGYQDRHLEVVRSYSFEDIMLEFTRMARGFDPNLSAADIYQAGRNLWSMNFVQLLLGLPVQLTPALFAYSLLYPYTDNYLDDPHITPEAKWAFNQRFNRRLAGEEIQPQDIQEQIICDLLGKIEDQYDRSSYPQVYESLSAIHQAQSRSLQLLQGGASPYEVDVLGISLEKGGTSVLADGYLVAGSLTPAQRQMMFAYGTFTQLVDDLEDTQSDLQAGLMTVFSQTARRWPLDGTTNRTIHFGKQVVDMLASGAAPGLEPLMEVMRMSFTPVLIDAAAQHRRYFSRAYVRELQHHFPLRFSALDKHRKKLYRQRAALGNLIEALITPGAAS